MATTFNARKQRLVVCAASGPLDGAREAFLSLAAQHEGDVVETPPHVLMAVWRPQKGDAACAFARAFAAGRPCRLGLSVGVCVARLEGQKRVMVFGDTVNVAIRIAGHETLAPGRAYADPDVAALVTDAAFTPVDGAELAHFGRPRPILRLE